MSKKRLTILFLIFVGLIGLMIIRVFYIQVMQGNNYSKEATAQRMSNTVIESIRGDFVDRNGIMLTGRTPKITVVLQPLLLKEQPADVIERISQLLGLDAEKTKSKIYTTKSPMLYEIDKETKAILMSMNIKGISFINSMSRYNTDTKAKHILGYMNKVDNIGSSGLEKLYQSVLDYGQNDSVSVITDANNNLLGGLGYRIIKNESNHNKKLDIRLTIDYHIQSIVEDVLDKRGLTGAVVVEDVNSGDIVAICSKPDFDPNDVEKYLDSNKRPLYNRAVAQYNIGSIFKLVDLAALFEIKPDFDMLYDCPGYIQVGDSTIKCSSFDKGGHGNIDLGQAFANSCNPYFIRMVLDIGITPVLSMSDSLGLGRETGLTLQGIDEAKGLIPTEQDVINPGDIANIAIGQGSILATPVQVANMVATIANGGTRYNVNLVDCVTDSDGNRIRDLENKQSKRIMAKSTAESIRALMEQVISEGTGKKANMDGYGGAGGKTGSAETGQLQDDQKITQAWFAGYFPANKPKYSVAIFIENGKSGSEAAAPVFAEIGSEIVRRGL